MRTAERVAETGRLTKLNFITKFDFEHFNLKTFTTHTDTRKHNHNFTICLFLSPVLFSFALFVSFFVVDKFSSTFFFSLQFGEREKKKRILSSVTRILNVIFAGKMKINSIFALFEQMNSVESLRLIVNHVEFQFLITSRLKFKKNTFVFMFYIQFYVLL